MSFSIIKADLEDYGALEEIRAECFVFSIMEVRAEDFSAANAITPNMIN